MLVFEGVVVFSVIEIECYIVWERVIWWFEVVVVGSCY